MRRLSLDHLTAVDAAPLHLIELARQTGCAGVCMFLEPMAVLPHMPHFDLIEDKSHQQQVRSALEDGGVTLDLAYPFTLTGRTVINEFSRKFECAASLGAGLVNVLLYDRDDVRREDMFGAFCDLAGSFGLGVAVEFYPASQVRTLSEALVLVEGVNRPGSVGVNADLLHLMRSGGSLADLGKAPEGRILFGQLCDGPADCANDRREVEASSSRLLPGQGVFDVAGFVEALPIGCPISVEVPRDAELVQGASVQDRASRAVAAARHALQGKPYQQPDSQECS